MHILQRISIYRIWMAGIVIHVLAAWFSKGYFHADEHFQLLEYASYKLHHNTLDNLPWEYTAGMRPSMQVAVASTFSYIFSFLSPFYIAFLLRLLSMTLAFLAIYHAGKTIFKDQDHLKLYYLLALFLWFMPYQYVRFASENWSGFLMLLSLVLILKDKPVIYSGMLSGLAFSCRYQAAFFIAGLFLWLLCIKKISFRQALLYISGFLLVFAAGIVTDHWLYGRWVMSSYTYFYVNLVEGKAAEFGTEPFYYYITRFIEAGIAPIALILIIAFIVYVFRQPKSIFTWVALPFFVLHCIIAHKELRFLFPLVYFIPVFAVEFIDMIKGTALIRTKFVHILVNLLLIVNMLLLPFSSFKASNPRISLLQHLYDRNIQPGEMVCLKENPYYDQLWFSYYFPLHFDPRQLAVIGEKDTIKRGKLVIMPYYTASNTDYEVIYRQVPAWMENLNVGHWMDRSNLWCIARKR